VQLLKLVWDAIGSEFAGRHQQYEMFYAGDPSVVQMRSFRSFRWDASTELVDACLALTAPATTPV
jgi:4-hydroxyphenylacetate 3-monooxygenase